MRTPGFAWRYSILILGLASLVACRPDTKPKGPRLQDALPFLPLPPNPTFVSRSGGDSAIQLVMTTPYPAESIAVLYRALLKQQGYVVNADQPAGTGGHTLFAMKSGHPLWILIVPNPTGDGTQVSINGAVSATVKDSAASNPAAPDTARKKAAPVRKPAGATKPRD